MKPLPIMSIQKIHLRDVAYARSGDKGSGATLGVIAYTAEGYQFIREQVTAEAVEAFFKPMGCGPVTRYELPNLGALNFVLPDVLAGGGSRSLRVDAQGKAIGQGALEMPLEIDTSLLPQCVRKDRKISQTNHSPI